MRWITPSYTKIHEVLSNPVYAGAYQVEEKRRLSGKVGGDGDLRRT
jgi:hypothetical protein